MCTLSPVELTEKAQCSLANESCPVDSESDGSSLKQDPLALKGRKGDAGISPPPVTPSRE